MARGEGRKAKRMAQAGEGKRRGEWTRKRTRERVRLGRKRGELQWESKSCGKEKRGREVRRGSK